jgi:hypothetical protein
MELILYESAAPADFWTENAVTASHSSPFILQTVLFCLFAPTSALLTHPFSHLFRVLNSVFPSSVHRFL